MSISFSKGCTILQTRARLRALLLTSPFQSYLSHRHALSCYRSSTHSFPMPHTDFNKQNKNISYGSLSILMLRKSCACSPSVACSSPRCVLQQTQLQQDLTVSRIIPNTTAMSDFTSKTILMSWILRSGKRNITYNKMPHTNY